MGNALTYVALIGWPLISVMFYRRFDLVTATFCTIVGGLLILPVNFEIDFPLLPPLDKSSISVLSALFCIRFIKRIRIGLLPETKSEKLLALILLASPIITVLNNQESIVSLSGEVTQGLTSSDVISSIISNYILLIPFIIGIVIVRSYEDQVKVFKLAVLSGLVYSLPILFEVRMSPQLHDWIYGYFPHSFVQQKRYGGFRPVVFLGHGLEVAMFVVITLAAAVTLWREKLKIRNFSNAAIVIILLVVLLFCKSVAPFIYGVFLLVAIRFLGHKTLIRGSIVAIGMFLLYPLLFLVDVFPHQMLIDFARDIDPDRAQSLEFRFKHEASLLEHARQKLYFGWGGWGRNKLETSVTDGAWIITLGKTGLVGFYALCGLAWFAIWKGRKAIKLEHDIKSKNLIAMHALIISISFIDQVPNASWNMWTWFLTGALIGRAFGVRQEALKNDLEKLDRPSEFDVARGRP